MLPYHPKCDWFTLPPNRPHTVSGVVPLPAPVWVAGDFSAGAFASAVSFFAKTIFFFSASATSDFLGVSSFPSDFGVAEGFALAIVASFGFGVGFGVGLGGVFGLGLGVPFTFGVGFGVAVDVGDGLDVGSWISLRAEVNTGRSSSSSRAPSLLDSVRGRDFSRSGRFFFSVTIPSPAPPFIQTTLCEPGSFLSRLQRINP